MAKVKARSTRREAGSAKRDIEVEVEPVAEPPPEVFTWVVVNAHGERFEIVAGDVEVDGGALVFSSGGELVRAFGPSAWHGLELKAEPTPAGEAGSGV